MEDEARVRARARVRRGRAIPAVDLDLGPLGQHGRVDMPRSVVYSVHSECVCVYRHVQLV